MASQLDSRSDAARLQILANPQQPQPGSRSAGSRVDARSCVEPGTGLAVAGAWVLCLFVCAFLVLTVYGAILAVVGAITSALLHKRARALLRASSLHVGPRQFPGIHSCVTDFARRLGIAEAPEVYVVDTSEVNGFALRFGRKNVVVLTDEAVAASLEGKSAGALAFVVAHELAHIALGHHRFWRSLLGRARWLSRKDEHSADRVACELVGMREAAEDGILLLCAGPRLLSFVDRAAAREQAAECVADRATRNAERALTHPTTMRRFDRVQRHFGGGERRAAA